MRGITNNWFKSFIKDRYCDIQMLQNVALMQCSVHHFADDTNLLFIDKSLKNINKHIHHTWSIFSNGSRTSLNVGKTKIIIFRNRFQQIKKLDFRVIKKKKSVFISKISRDPFNPHSHGTLVCLNLYQNSTEQLVCYLW